MPKWRLPLDVPVGMPFHADVVQGTVQDIEHPNLPKMGNDLEDTQEDPAVRKQLLEDDLGKERLRVREINEETAEM